MPGTYYLKLLEFIDDTRVRDFLLDHFEQFSEDLQDLLIQKGFWLLNQSNSLDSKAKNGFKASKDESILFNNIFRKKEKFEFQRVNKNGFRVSDEFMQTLFIQDYYLVNPQTCVKY